MDYAGTISSPVPKEGHTARDQALFDIEDAEAKEKGPDLGSVLRGCISERSNILKERLGGTAEGAKEWANGVGQNLKRLEPLYYSAAAKTIPSMAMVAEVMQKFSIDFDMPLQDGTMLALAFIYPFVVKIASEVYANMKQKISDRELNVTQNSNEPLPV